MLVDLIETKEKEIEAIAFSRIQRPTPTIRGVRVGFSSPPTALIK